MRWYCVLCFAASRLKKSTLRLLRARVTFMPSSRNTRSSGAGRKSGTTLGLPKGSSVYLVFALIDPLSFAPIARAKDPNDIGAVRKIALSALRHVTHSQTNRHMCVWLGYVA